jgi:DNA-binding MltR family transcriptional regulator
MNQLVGYRSYILGGLIVVFAVLYGLGVIDKELFEAILALLGGGSVLSLRAAIDNK